MDRMTQSSPTAARPEIGASIDAAGITTNYLEAGAGDPVVLIHGSGPGVGAWVNWNRAMPVLAERFHVYAPDMVGFGFTERPAGVVYELETWVRQLVGFLDALGIERASVAGNSFGGALALRLAATHPDRVARLVLQGSMGVSFPLTEGCDAAWGYQPSPENMRRLFDYFTYDKSLISDELAEARYRASLEPGMQEAFASMFPPPRQQGIEALTTPEGDIRAIPHETLIVHGRDDEVIPPANAFKLLSLIPRAELHVFGQCGHWTQIERADDFAALLVQFLERPASPH